MPSTYTDILGLELQETGENLNAWGARLNQALRLVDDSQSFEVIPLTGNLSLSNTMNQPNQARKAALAFTDGGLTSAPTVTLPPVKRLRYVENRGSTYAITFTVGNAAGVLPPGRKALVLCNGADVSVVDWVADTDNARIAAQAARDLAQSWASLTGVQVAGTDYSAKEYAVGTTAPAGSAKGWATKTGSTVDGAEYAAKEYASGSAVPSGSARQWSLRVGSAVSGTDYSAREHAVGTTVPAGSAQQWASKTGSAVASSEFSAKEYAVGDLTATGGSSKAWAMDAVSPDGTSNKSAKSYASDAASSATSSANSASSASASASAAADSYDAFDDRYLGSKAANPTTDNDGNALLVGALYFNAASNEMRVWNGAAWQSPVPAAADYVPKTRLVSTGTGLTGGGDLSADRTISADFATQAEAQAGTATGKSMNPLRVAQAIAALAPAPPVPGLVFISAQTVSSAVAAVDFTGLSNAYDEYVIHFQNVVPSADTNFNLRTSANNGSSFDAGSTDYSHSVLESLNGVNNGGGSPANSLIPVAGFLNGLRLGQQFGGASGEVVISRPASTTEGTQIRTISTFTPPGGDQLATGITSGNRRAVAAVNAVRLFMGSGNIASGTFKLYGMRKS
ncbi:hypothetical protein [Aureimonas sp. AU20]|uniref:hypothetical protein n=1 Tax=Aureimonas sp. AU20 TaxID=1349819 RepID=UPI0007218BAD|nr:hypothetical protein [Aureimonas sp. AU20]ALN73531.1 hypothetical protein M673_12462 [Aureimonas sp. AU20]